MNATMTNNQTNKRKSFIIHKDSIEILDKLTDEQAGKLFKAIKFYQKTGELPTLDFTLDLVFTPFLNQFIRDDEDYKKICEARREAGSKGGKQKVAKGSKRKQKVANLADSDSKSDSDNKNKNEINTPDFIDKNLLNDFFAFRESIATKQKPFTKRARELLVKDLVKFEAMQVGFANASLENSIKNSWLGVFEPNKGNLDSKKTTDSKANKLNSIAGSEIFSKVEELEESVNLYCINPSQAAGLSQDIKDKIKAELNNKKITLR